MWPRRAYVNISNMNMNRLDEVYTKDNQHLGAAQRLYHRTTEVRPELKYYETYMLVGSIALGDNFYVPTDFLAGRDPQTGRIVLSVTGRNVEKKTWTRLPDFILHGEARTEELAARTQVAP